MMPALAIVSKHRGSQLRSRQIPTSTPEFSAELLLRVNGWTYTEHDRRRVSIVWRFRPCRTHLLSSRGLPKFFNLLVLASSAHDCSCSWNERRGAICSPNCTCIQPRNQPGISRVLRRVKYGYYNWNMPKISLTAVIRVCKTMVLVLGGPLR
jgi:hypothetical protein